MSFDEAKDRVAPEQIEKYSKLMAEFMGWKPPVVGSFWNYNRQLCHSTNQKNLIVLDVNERGVAFEQKMAFERYGVGFFNGIVFYPSDWAVEYNLNDFHCPARPYHTDWNWLHRVWEKFRDLLVDDESNQWQHAIKCRRVAEKLTWHYSLEEAFLELGKAIEWYQTIKK